VTQQRVYQVPIRDADELRRQLVETRSECQQGVVVDAVVHRRKRLKAYINGEYGQF